MATFCFSARLDNSALPAEPRDLPGLKESAALTPSLSKSLASTKAIWGAAQSLSNKITFSSSTLHGPDCRALRLLLPRLSSSSTPSNPGLHDWLRLKEPHARGGSQKHCQSQKKRPPAHQTKLHSQNAMGNRKNEKKGSKREKKIEQIKGKASHNLPLWSWQTKEQIARLRHDSEGQNWHRVPLSTVCMWTCIYRFHQFPHESQRGAQTQLSAFHLGFFCIPLRLCLLFFSSIGQNWLLLLQTALSLLMPQVSGLCTLGLASGQNCSQSP